MSRISDVDLPRFKGDNFEILIYFFKEKEGREGEVIGNLGKGRGEVPIRPLEANQRARGERSERQIKPARITVIDGRGLTRAQNHSY